MKQVIVGGGVAGVTAARALAAAGGQQVTLLESEPRPYYLRPGLIDYLAGTKTLDDLTPFPRSWYEERGIDYRTGTAVAEIRPRGKKVLLATGEAIAYDRLLLATGAQAFRPPIPGAELPGVFTLRSATDAEAIRTRAQEASRALVIGGGWLGLEAARALRNYDLAVTVLEIAPWLLGRQLDRPGAEVLAGQLAKLGIEVITGVGCQELRGGQEVEKAILADGRELATDLVVISAGVRSRTALAAAAGLQVNRGIVVDDRLATSAPDIYAAGDCAEWNGRVYGIVPASHDQAEIAAANMLSPGSASYRGTVTHNQLKIAGVELLILGDAQPQGGPAEEHRRADPEQGVYRKLVVKDGRLIGAILLGDLSGRGTIKELITTGQPVGDQLAKLLSGSGS